MGHRWAAAAMAALAVAGCTRASPGAMTSDQGASGANGTVVHVVDGDTVQIDFGRVTESVRLIGIDTPETVKPDTPVQCFGPEASARTKDLLPEGTPVRVERDAEPRDVYGRLLAYVTRAGDGLFVNLSLVTDGYAVPLTIEPNTAYRDEFVAAATSAEAAGAGLWGACSG